MFCYTGFIDVLILGMVLDLVAHRLLGVELLHHQITDVDIFLLELEHLLIRNILDSLGNLLLHNFGGLGALRSEIRLEKHFVFAWVYLVLNLLDP